MGTNLVPFLMDKPSTTIKFGQSESMSTMSTRERMDTIPYDRFRAEYLSEIREGTRAMRLPEFKIMLERMTRYPAYAKSRTGVNDPLALIVKESRGSCVIDLTRPGPESRLAIYTAQMAAVCVLVEGANLPRAPTLRRGFGRRWVRCAIWATRRAGRTFTHRR